ncbi:zinc-dependent metalloprotease [Aureibaculum sp. 2210JD6-5]|uniref:zinc-dependent metalloprotease n=1 Tax=Aureibaculum sp. 2210JD6-5 TaxID=3103957 RepID=UPI002AADBD4A|nr:zinc-dependent metalloprotease [Aureibaculum sp. 2210JD6-5]MDY7396858.1 zinc-dependent metalloprotease [Aureibaculum sp. 2210JD6-5]
MKKIKSISVLLVLLCYSIWSFAQISLSNIKPYKEIITVEAITEKGFVTTHFLNGKIYLEIPEVILGKDLLFVNHNNSSFDKETLINLKRRNNIIQVIVPEIDSKVGNTIQLLEGRFDIKITPASFPILTMGNNKPSYIIDATSLFLNTPKGLQDGGKSIVNETTFIDIVRSFANSVEVNTTTTVASEKGPLTTNVDFSIMLLPEPMMPRLYDHRMGFYSENMFFNNFNESVRASIARWRLEKKYPSQSLSEPIRPIVFYIDPAIPNIWKPYVKAGVYEWLPAFEAAGFENAIIVKDAPVHNKDWSINSMRYSVIRWENRSKYRGHKGEGFGAVRQIIDQRTGEILKADILIGMIDKLVDLYFTRCSPLDKRAQQHPFPDDLMGELIQSLTAHETGHAFGIKDANFGEYTYPFEKMRDKKWLQKMGHSPSVMNYARENFIVQPEDNIPPNLLHQKVGPTDIYNIRWAYTQFENISTPDDEFYYLEKIIREQDTTPWYRYNLEVQSIGPETINEVVENNNPIKSAELGLKNLKRVVNLIPTIDMNERDDKVKKRFYNGTLNFWLDQMKYVESLVGGYTIQYKSSTQKGLVYTPIPFYRQKEAVKFLNKEVFNPPLWLVRPDITGRFIAADAHSLDGKSSFINSTINIISRKQRKILQNLFSPTKMRVLEENGVSGKGNYNIADMLQDLNEDLWRELKEESVKIDVYRQEIQLAYIFYLMDALVYETKKHQRESIYVAYNKYFYSNYTRGTIFNELNNVKDSIKKVIHRVEDISTKNHLELCLLEINKLKT